MENGKWRIESRGAERRESRAEEQEGLKEKKSCTFFMIPNALIIAGSSSQTQKEKAIL